MVLMNVSFGIIAFMPLGWLFMLFIIFLESTIYARYYEKKWFLRTISKVTFLSNFVSGLIGFAISMFLSGGWWLVVWLPWVSNNEVDLTKSNHLITLIVYYIIAFILSVIIEGLVNYLCLRKYYSKNRIFKATLIANTISYVVASIIMYSYSFIYLEY